MTDYHFTNLRKITAFVMLVCTDTSKGGTPGKYRGQQKFTSEEERFFVSVFKNCAAVGVPDEERYETHNILSI